MRTETLSRESEKAPCEARKSVAGRVWAISTGVLLRLWLRRKPFAKAQGSTAKFLLACKAVSSPSFTQLIKLELEVPLEVAGNNNPR